MRTTIYSSVPQKLLSALVIISMVMVALPVTMAHAASTITVTTTADEFTSIGNPECSLREAIFLANSNASTANDCSRIGGIDADDIIVLESGSTYTLTIPGAGGTSVGDLDVGDSGGASGNLTIQTTGLAPATINGGDIDRVLDVDAVGNYSLTLNNIVVTNGNTTGLSTTTGGGISFAGTGTLTLTNSTVSDNVSANGAGCGGGIYNNSGAAIVITDSTISGNSCPTAGSDGAGIFKGGGGSLTITGSTISGNSTAENGGGIHIGTGASTITVNITNSTIASNTAGTRGGGLQVGGSTAVVNIDFSTFSDNIANAMPSPDLNGGGALQVSLGSVTVTRSILANSIVTNGVLGQAKDCDKSGTAVASITDSVVELNNDCAVSGVTVGDPSLVALADNGGPTQTMAIPITSTAYNTADSCGTSTTDQRGFSRPQVGTCDLGAFEIQNPTSPTVISVIRANASPTNASSVDFTVTFSESVTGVDAGDFNLVSTGVTGASISGVSGSGDTYTVTVNTGSGDGTLQLDVIDNDTITDGGNFLDGGFTSGEVYTVDKTAPTVSITRADNYVMASSTVDFSVAFSETVTGVNQNDFQLVPTDVTGASLSGFNGVGSTYTVTANTGSGDGSLGLDLKSSGTGIADAAGNPIVGGSTGEVYTILKSAAVADVLIGTNNEPDQTIPLGGRVSVEYGINGGPVHVSSVNGLPIFTSQRAIYLSSFNSIVGYAGNQLTTEYWFTSYDDKGMITFLVIGNPDPALTAEVDVFIAGTFKAHYSIAPGQRVFPRYGINAGPVHVVSTNGVNIFTSERTKFQQSFNEVMGYPADQLTTEYWFTSYDDAGMITYLVVGNPHETQTAEVDVYIGGNKMNATPYQIAPGQRIFPRYGINSGPVRVVSTNGVDIFSSERTKFGDTFNEVMGFPGDQVSTEFWFTSYDDTSMITFLVVGNPSSSQTAEVDVYIGGVKQNASSISIAPGQRFFARYGMNSGPVHVISTNGVDVFASERSKYLQSFNEILGLADSQLTTDYWFTSYDDSGMDTKLVIGAPE